jgi:hypothetical protein
MKTCKICGIEKEDSEYFFTNGHIRLQPHCKVCHNEYNKERYKITEGEYYKRPENIITRRLYQNNEVQLAKRKTYWQENFKGKYYENYKEWYYKYPEKVAGQVAVRKLKVEKGINKHHWSYNEEHREDVILLTRQKHSLAHKHMIYDQERMMYRTLQCVLLDTKEDHINYIDSIK